MRSVPHSEALLGLCVRVTLHIIIAVLNSR